MRGSIPTKTAASMLGAEQGVVPGAAILSVSAVWTLLVLGGLLPPRAAALTGGVAGVLVGAMATTSSAWGHGLVVALLVAVAAVSVRFREVGPLVVSGVMALQELPQLVGRYLAGSAVGPLVVLLLGTVLLGFGIVRLRRADEGALRPVRHLALSQRAAALSAGVAAVGGLAAVLALGLI